jgi:pimeloyl-ACP methyl ester carboxylesterase
MKKILFILLTINLLSSCQKEKINLISEANDTFYFDNEGASMRVQVHGNTASKVIMLIVHGGPGIGAIAYRTDLEKIEENYGVAYWDQRMAGFSQGNSNIESLQMEQQGKDAKAVLLTLKARYGTDCKFFMYGQSWGGMVTSSFMTQGDNQNLINGWVFANATHDYLRNDQITEQMMLDSSKIEIAKGNNVADWKEIVDFCDANVPNLDVDVSHKYNRLASKAQRLYDYRYNRETPNPLKSLLSTSGNQPVTASIPDLRNNYFYDTFAAEILATSFTSRLNKVTLPTLVFSGAYDFVCPALLQKEFFESLGGTQNKYLLMANSTHGMEEKEAYQAAILSFIDEFK